MQPTNFSRQFIMASHIFDCVDMPWVNGTVKLIEYATKFMLPDGGIIFEDREFRGLCGLRLAMPFEFVTVEYREEEYNVIVSALDLEEKISLSLVIFDKVENKWVCYPPVFLKKDDWLCLDEFPSPPKIFLSQYYVEEGQECTWTDVVVKFLYFLNATSCSNVHFEKINKVKKTTKASVEFDEYHVLTIGGRKESSYLESNCEKRSPREHLRRGHIRVLQSGGRVWVNSCVVAKGSKGRIFKDYEVKLH